MQVTFVFVSYIIMIVLKSCAEDSEWTSGEIGSDLYFWDHNVGVMRRKIVAFNFSCI